MRICYWNFQNWYNKSSRIFWFEQLLFNKVDFGASNFEAALQLQTVVKWKLLGRSVTFGPKSVEKHPIKGTLKNLTTPNAYISFYVFFFIDRPSNTTPNGGEVAVIIDIIRRARLGNFDPNIAGPM